ncbi:MAG TPA: hypothetical protein VMW48_19495, partial [Vicinamibacterales bacterium]|nr:hypothetical protein [Vicinamibacterales bacterium]
MLMFEPIGGKHTLLNATTHSLDLNGEWLLTYGPEDGSGPGSPEELANTNWPTIPATVPGNVELDLVAAGRLEDPSTGNRIYALRELEANEWWYRRSFNGPVIDAGQCAELVFGGLDCLATIWLNGEITGTADNMLIPHRFDITSALRQREENELVIRISSAVLAGWRHERSVWEHPLPGGWEALAIRKAPHMYGWDIMPRVVSAGLWRDVTIEITPRTRWRSVYWATLDVDVADRTATVMVDWSFETDR